MQTYDVLLIEYVPHKYTESSPKAVRLSAADTDSSTCVWYSCTLQKNLHANLQARLDLHLMSPSDPCVSLIVFHHSWQVLIQSPKTSSQTLHRLCTNTQSKCNLTALIFHTWEAIVKSFITVTSKPCKRWLCRLLTRCWVVKQAITTVWQLQSGLASDSSITSYRQQVFLSCTRSLQLWLDCLANAEYCLSIKDYR